MGHTPDRPYLAPLIASGLRLLCAEHTLPGRQDGSPRQGPPGRAATWWPWDVSPALPVPMETPVGTVRGPGHRLELFWDICVLHVWDRTSTNEDQLTRPGVSPTPVRLRLTQLLPLAVQQEADRGHIPGCALPVHLVCVLRAEVPEAPQGPAWACLGCPAGCSGRAATVSFALPPCAWGRAQRTAHAQWLSLVTQEGGSEVSL